MAKIHRWPLGIIIVYSVFVLFLLGVFVFSRFHQVELVSKSYYDDELHYQQQINRMQRTQDQEVSPVIRYRRSSKQVAVEFPREMARPDTRGRIVFFRPSNARLDFAVPLQLDEQGRQLISAGSIATGLWKVKIEWQTAEAEYYHEDTVILTQ
ncbi:MAG: hypothetical protein D6814_06410 [Calditrichaeota bacterium]|nr:MAG: hypothetical protein D6814_06410 [Calditrichota bacterium]